MRKQIDDKSITDAFIALRNHLIIVLNNKGRGTFASSHEVLGVLTDERSETIQAIQRKAGLEAIRHELLDEAVTAIFAVACIDEGTLEW